MSLWINIVGCQRCQLVKFYNFLAIVNQFCYKVQSKEKYVGKRNCITHLRMAPQTFDKNKPFCFCKDCGEILFLKREKRSEKN